MKKIVLDTKRSQVILADETQQDGDSLIVLCAGKRRTIQLDKIAYIEDVEILSFDPEPLYKQEAPHVPEPVVSNVQPPIKMASSFSEAVNRRLRDAPAPDPYDDLPPKDATSLVYVELIGSTSGTYEVMTDADSFAAANVKERLVSDIFSNAALKESLKQHNVVGIVKEGNLVKLDCRQKPPVQPGAMSASVTSLVNNIVSLVSPAVKLPDIPLQATNEDTKK